MSRIFVSIPSYRDIECQYTIKDLFEKAVHKDKIFVGVCFQYNKDTDKDCFVDWPHEYDDQIRIDHVDSSLACGPCWARYRAQQLWKQEEYYLSIDSHTRFVDGWDQLLFKLLEQCNSKKPILTAYPVGYERGQSLPLDHNPTAICAKDFGKDGILRLTGQVLESSSMKVIPSLFWVAGFNFSSSKVIEEVPYDPHLRHIFFGEEISMSTRLWTHGWDFFSPCVNIVFHLWNRSYRPLFGENPICIEDNKKSINRINYILNINDSYNEKCLENIHIYGNGDIRSVKDYEDFCGVSFKEKKINEKAKYGGLEKTMFYNHKVNTVLNLVNQFLNKS